MIYSLKRTLKKYTNVVAFTVSITSLSAAISSYVLFAQVNAQNESRRVRLIENSMAMQLALVHCFSYTDFMLRITGEKLRNLRNRDASAISKILSSPSITNEFSRNLFAWNLFDWSDENFKMLASSLNGVYARPFDVASRAYVVEGSTYPWKLIFDRSDVGISSKRKIIPAGMAITSDKNDIIGFLSLGFDLNKMKVKLLEARVDKEVEFLLLDADFNPVLGSSYSYSFAEREFKNKDIRKILEKNLTQKTRNAELLLIGTVEYGDLHKVTGYPFYLLTGFDVSYLNAQKSALFLPSVIGITIISLFSIISTIFLNYKIIKFSRSISGLLRSFRESNKLGRINFRSFFLPEFRELVIEIKALFAKMRDYKFEIFKKRKEIELYKQSIENIFKLTKLLEGFSLENHVYTKPTIIDLAKFIKEINSYFYTYTCAHNIEIVINEKNVPNIKSIAEILKISLFGLISNVLKFSKEGSKIEISLICPNLAGESVPNISLNIKHSCVGLSEEGRDELVEIALGGKLATYQDGFYITRIKTLKQYFRSIGGTVSMQTKKSAGTNFIVELPLSVTKESSANEMGNIIPMKKK